MRRLGGCRTGALRALAAGGVALALGAGVALAQESVLLDPSARSGGMGGASAAVAWGGSPNLWANPALVNATPGFAVQLTTEQLVPGYSSDTRFGTTRFVASFAGIGWTSSGRPLGATQLDYGPTALSGGLSLPPYSLVEDTRADGIGISVASLADAIAAACGRNTRFAGIADVAWGRQWKQVRSALLAPRLAGRDEGWLVRLTPLDTRRGGGAATGGARIEIAYAHAVLDDPSSSEPVLLLPGPGTYEQSLPRDRRDAGALRLSWFGPSRGAAPGAALTDAFRGGLGPLVDLTIAYDRERVDQPRNPGIAGYLVEHWGLDATIVRVLSARVGYVSDRDGQVTKPTWGLGACVPLSRNGEVRYDFASWPQSYPRRVYRHEVAVRVDPLTRWLGMRPEDRNRAGD